MKRTTILLFAFGVLTLAFLARPAAARDHDPSRHDDHDDHGGRLQLVEATVAQLQKAMRDAAHHGRAARAACTSRASTPMKRRGRA